MQNQIILQSEVHCPHSCVAEFGFGTHWFWKYGAVDFSSEFWARQCGKCHSETAAWDIIKIHRRWFVLFELLVKCVHSLDKRQWSLLSLGLQKTMKCSPRSCACDLGLMQFDHCVITDLYIHPSTLKEIRSWWCRPFLLESNLSGCLHTYENICINALCNSKFLGHPAMAKGHWRWWNIAQSFAAIFLAANPVEFVLVTRLGSV